MQEYIDSFFQEQKQEYSLIGICDISDSELEQICGKDTKKIKRLDIDFSNITRKGFFVLTTAVWTNLRLFRMANTTMDDTCCKYLSKIALPNVQDIAINGNKISRIGMLHLFKSQWPKISHLRMGNQLQLDSLKQVAFGHWPQLKTIGIFGNRLTLPSLIQLILSSFQELLELYVTIYEKSPQQCSSLTSKFKKKFQKVIISLMD